MDVVVRDGIAYVADGLEGLRIVDVSDPTAPVDLGFWILTAEAVALDVDDAGDIAYVGGMNNLLHVVDVSDPSSPLGLSTVNIPEVPFGVDVEDGIAYVAAGPAGLRIIDVTDPLAPRNIGSFTVPGARCDNDWQPIVVSGTTVYQAVCPSSTSRIEVLDASDPAHPVEIGHHDMETTLSGLFVDDQYVYVTEQNRGLTIFRRR
jgi:hypothetical protein